MLQHEKLPFTRPPSPVPDTTNEQSTNLHRYFVIATFVAYFALDFVSNILATRLYVSSFSDFLYLFAGDIVAAVIFSKYTLLEKTPRYNRLLSFYFVAVGFLYPLAVGASILVERAQGNDPHLYFDRGYDGAQITYCSVRTYADFGHRPEYNFEDYDKPSRWCWTLFTSSKTMVLFLAIGFGAVRWIAKRRTNSHIALSTDIESVK